MRKSRVGLEQNKSWPVFPVVFHGQIPAGFVIPKKEKGQAHNEAEILGRSSGKRIRQFSEGGISPAFLKEFVVREKIHVQLCWEGSACGARIPLGPSWSNSNPGPTLPTARGCRMFGKGESSYLKFLTQGNKEQLGT